jgi:dipeptidase E
MKMYLSSYRIGKEGHVLRNLVTGKKRIGVIRNALDFSDDTLRLAEGKKREFDDLKNLGLCPEEIDLRMYFNSHEKLLDKIEQLDALWVTGGNSFVLLRAMRLSGFDTILHQLKHKDEFVYAGYSAGITVLAPTLNGIHLVDDPNIVPQGYPRECSWDGLSFISFCFAPHYKSDHPESSAIDKVVEFFIANRIPFVALHDGDVHIIEK